MPKELRLLYDGAFKLNNERLRGKLEWHLSENRRLRKWAAAEAAASGVRFDRPVHVFARPIYESGSPPDADSIALAMKHIIDGLCDNKKTGHVGIIPNDGPRWLAAVTYLAAQRGTGRKIAIVIREYE